MFRGLTCIHTAAAGPLPATKDSPVPEGAPLLWACSWLMLSPLPSPSGPGSLALGQPPHHSRLTPTPGSHLQCCRPQGPQLSSPGCRVCCSAAARSEAPLPLPSAYFSQLSFQDPCLHISTGWGSPMFNDLGLLLSPWTVPARLPHLIQKCTVHLPVPTSGLNFTDTKV